MGGKSGSKKKSKHEEQEAPSSPTYNVEKIVADRIIKGKTQYKVRWQGYSTEDETWENESQLDCTELLDEYLSEKKYNEATDIDVTLPTPTKSGRKRKSNKNHESPSKTSKEELPPESSSSEQNSTTEQEQEYAVEKIVGKRNRGAKVQYKVAWEGYSAEHDTWENESQLDCKDLIEEYLNEIDESDHGKVNEKKEKVQKRKKTSSKEKNNVTKSAKPGPGPVNGEDEYEVERIIEMHTLRTGKREFLVRWAGFSKADDTWEPEEHIDENLLDKFLQKVEKAKELTEKELRVNRKPTDRFTSMPQGDKRRQSKRYANQQRVKYYDAE